MYRFPMIACLLFLLGVWLLPAATGQTPYKDGVIWVATPVPPPPGTRDLALEAAKRSLPAAKPDQVAFVQITSTSANQPVPVVTFYGWRMHYAAAAVGTNPKLSLTLLLNGASPVDGGWPPYGLVAILSDRTQSLAPR
ncbi:hypothetical protein [Duganella sp. HH105]|uniref:hypothetical protein n=1 Tax=Duganella sp. HH105 TaxID=1781067 RepID=UPI000877D993|nr:hypothetical protein [Duganella sp. HH105]OEZ62018.1 hypothetical protein DUGA6_17020 [Duganella sp. HH105]